MKLIFLKISSSSGQYAQVRRSGGSWSIDAKYSSAKRRYKDGPQCRFGNLGLRCARMEVK